MDAALLRPRSMSSARDILGVPINGKLERCVDRKASCNF
jgi:hypothetical protein